MTHKGRSRRVVALAMALVMLLASGPLNLSQAAMVTTDEVIEAQTLAGERAKVLQFVAREDVRRQMREMGIDPEEAARRAASLSDEEIRLIAGRLDHEPAGQGAFVALIVAAGALFLLLIVTDLLGLTDVFPFVKSQRSDSN